MHYVRTASISYQTYIHFFYITSTVYPSNITILHWVDLFDLDLADAPHEPLDGNIADVPTKLTIPEILEAQRTDAFCQTVLSRQAVKLDTLFHEDDDGVLRRQHPRQSDVKQIVLPESLHGFFPFSGFCVTPVIEQTTLYAFLRVTIHEVLVQSPATPWQSPPHLSSSSSANTTNRWAHICASFQMKDPRRQPGAVVTAKAIHITAEVECGRFFGALAKTKRVIGTVLHVYTDRTMRRARTLVEADWKLPDRVVRKTLNLCSVQSFENSTDSNDRSVHF